jgi:hypothetical protein
MSGTPTRAKAHAKTILLNGLLLIALTAAAPAQAAMTGADFLQANASYQNGFVSGFVRGMYLTCLDHLDARKQICSFEPMLDAAFELTPDQVLSQFLAYLRGNGAARQKEAAEALVDCLRDMAQKPR